MDADPQDLLAEDLATFALDLAQVRTTGDVLSTVADAVVVPHDATAASPHRPVPEGTP